MHIGRCISYDVSKQRRIWIIPLAHFRTGRRASRTRSSSRWRRGPSFSPSFSTSASWLTSCRKRCRKWRLRLFWVKKTDLFSLFVYITQLSPSRGVFLAEMTRQQTTRKENSLNGRERKKKISKVTSIGHQVFEVNKKIKRGRGVSFLLNVF